MSDAAHPAPHGSPKASPTLMKLAQGFFTGRFSCFIEASHRDDPCWVLYADDDDACHCELSTWQGPEHRGWFCLLVGAATGELHSDQDGVGAAGPQSIAPFHVLAFHIVSVDLGTGVYGVELGGWEVSGSQWLELTRRFREHIGCRLGGPSAVLSLSQSHYRVLYEYRPMNTQQDLERCFRFGKALQDAQAYAFNGFDRPNAAYFDVKTLH